MPDLEQILSPILNNQVVTGLSFTALLAGVGYQLRRVPQIITFWVKRLTLVTLTVRSDDEAFQWLDRWLSKQPYSGKARSVELNSYHEDSDEDDPYVGRNTNAWTLSPGQGVHWFFWRKRLVYLGRHEADKGNNFSRVEILSVTIPGFGQDALRELVADAKSLRDGEPTVKISVFEGSRWRPSPGRPIRGLSSVVLSSGQANRIIDDSQRFLGARAWYAHRGIPWRRGYLFSGVPGTGKTTFVLVLAGVLQRPVYVLSLNDVLSDSSLVNAVMSAAYDAIIVIEDIDCVRASTDRAKEAQQEEKGVTRAGLLNVLDGLITPEGRIFIMTTNYPDRLDAALLRPGRVDLHEKFLELSGPEQVLMAERYYGHGGFHPVPFPVAPAMLQGVFMRHPDDPAGARETLLREARPEVREAA